MKAFLSIISLLSATISVAQERATGGGNIEVIEALVSERMSRGKLDFCEITYLIGYEDYVYNQGAVTALRGSLSFAGFIEEKDKSPIVMFKVTAFNFDGKNFILAPLDYAYLSTTSDNYASQEFVMGAAEDGGLLVGYDAMSNMALPSQLSEKIYINIVKNGGRSDVSVPFSLLAIDAEKSLKYSDCSMRLLDGIIAKFQN